MYETEVLGKYVHYIIYSTRFSNYSIKIISQFLGTKSYHTVDGFPSTTIMSGILCKLRVCRVRFRGIMCESLVECCDWPFLVVGV